MHPQSTQEPRAADEVGLTFHAGEPGERRTTLGKVTRMLGRYAPAARGSSSTVWRFMPRSEGAADPAKDSFALKRCPAEPANGLRCPRTEFTFLSRLSSPLFPRAIAHGVMENGDYVVLSEWIEGRNLARNALDILTDALRNGTYERFCRDLLAALSQLQAARIEHSDIWEPNIIVRNDRPVLVDFGWAREAGTPPLNPTLHQSDDVLAMNQMLMRLGALHDLLLLESQVAALSPGGRPS